MGDNWIKSAIEAERRFFKEASAEDIKDALEKAEYAYYTEKWDSMSVLEGADHRIATLTTYAENPQAVTWTEFDYRSGPQDVNNVAANDYSYSMAA